LISGGSPTIRMATRISGWVGLGLDDTAAQPASPDRAHDGFSDEISGQLSRIRWQTAPRQRLHLMREMRGGLQ
ncbi:MAG: hypothetical protein WBG35_16165, partial [Acidobacteriaceae bacterium]